MNTGKGFTLIELLIVMVLIGVITGTAMLSMSAADPRDQQKQEAQRLLRLLEMAVQETVARGDILGLEFFSQGYRFTRLQNNKWQPESGDMLFKAHALGPQMELKLRKDHKDILLSHESIELISPKPQIIFTPDGDLGLFEINLSIKNGDGILTVLNTQQDGLTIRTENPR